MARSLAEQLDSDDPTPWIPDDAGDSITGEIESIDTREGDWGPYPVITVLADDGEAYSIAGFGVVLHNRQGTGKFDSITDADIGRTLGVKYLGDKEPKGGGKPYHNFKVVISPRTAVGVAATSSFPEDDEDL